MAEFGINDILNTCRTSTPDSGTGFREIWLDPYEARPSEHNFYSLEKIEELADSILAVGQQQPTVLALVNGEYRIVSGHRRNLANILNIERGLSKRRKIRYFYKEMTESMFELSLLMGNAYNRELTAWEKTQQAQKLKEALIKAKKEDGLEISGKLRSLVAGLMNESSSNIARMDMIHKNASPEIKEAFKKGALGISAAYEASRLPAEAQKAVAAKAGTEGIQAKEISGMRGKENTPSSCPEVEETTAGNPHPPHSRNGWSRTEAAPPPDTITGAQKNVSESGTLKNAGNHTREAASILKALIPYADRITAEELHGLRRLLLRCQNSEKN